MAGNKLLITTKDLAIISLMTTILFVQEQLLTSLPGIQLTFFLIVLFSKKLGFTRIEKIKNKETYLRFCMEVR